jgi:hypothetical protein
MIVNDFKIMIEKGLKSCPNDLESYLIRESKKAERDHFMTLESFVLLCRTAIEVDWEHTKNERLNDTLYLPYEFYEHIIEILEHLQNELNTLPPQPIVKQKKTEETPKTFEGLFYNTDLVTPSIDILKEIEPPLIDTEYNYIGKLKGIICVWIDELQRQGIVKSNYPKERKLFAALIPQKIKRFSIDESMFGKYQSKAEDNYRTDIKTKVSKIKLSQNSHLGKQGKMSL